MTACPVFVTGGSGVVGRHVVAALVRRGTPVRALARSARAAGIVTAAGAEPVPGELGDRDALRRGLTGAAAVIHCAARLEQGGPRAGYLTDNLHRTVEVLESARACGVGRFVHIGAAMCLLGGPPVDGADETWPLREPGYSGYIISKTRADAAVRAANSPGFTTVVVRPGWVWGTVDDPQLRETAQAVRAGKMRLIDHGRHRIVTSHVDNTVEAVVLALRHGRGGSGYYAFDDEPTTVSQFLRDLMHTQGLELPDASLPAPVAHAVAATLSVAWKALRRPGQPPISRLLVTLNSGPFLVSDRLARAELGYRPVTSRPDGLARLAQHAQIPDRGR